MKTLVLSWNPVETASRYALQVSRNRLFVDNLIDVGERTKARATLGLKGEGTMVIEYTEVEVTLGDGTVVSLREPAYSVADLGYGPMADAVLISPRVAP